MKNKLIRFTMGTLLCIAMLCSTVLADFSSGESVFPDVPANASYAEAVRTLQQIGVFGGDDKGNFNPDKTITRAETAKVICLLMGLGDEAQSRKKQVFSDVPASHWAAGYVATASESGVIEGLGDGRFGPDNPLTYEHIVTMLIRAWGYREEAIQQGGWPDGYLKVADDLGIMAGITQTTSMPAPRYAVALISYRMIMLPTNTEGGSIG